MARGSRTDNYAEINHILVQGIDGNAIFEVDAYKDYFLKALDKARNKTGAVILAYAIMNTHAHIIVKSNSIEQLSHFMSALSIKYARFYNIVTIREGKVFDKRYISEPIIGAENFVSCLAFIHNNPIKLGLVDKQSAYRYTSYNTYLENNNSLVDVVEGSKIIATLTDEEIEANSNADTLKWSEDVSSKAENIDKVLKELLLRYNVTNRAQLWNEELLRNLSNELMDRCNLSIRKVAEKLQIGRETLRKIIVNKK